MAWEVGALVVGVAGSVAAPPRVRAWVVASAVAAAALLVGIVPWRVFGDAVDALAAPLAFLVLAVPLAVLLDEIGFFGALRRRSAPRGICGSRCGASARGHGAVQPRRRGRAAHTAVRTHRAPPRRRRHRARVHPHVARVAGVVGPSGVEPHQPRAGRSTAPRSRRLPRARGSGRGSPRRSSAGSHIAGPPESNRPTSLHPSSSTGTHCEPARRSSRSSCSASRLATRSASRRGSSPGSRSRPSAHGLDGSRGDTSHLPRSRSPSRSARSRSVRHRLSTSTASCRSTARRGRHSRSERPSSARTR